MPIGNNVEVLKFLLTQDHDYDSGKIIRERLHELALRSYVPVYSDSQYLKFMENNQCVFDKVPNQSKNTPCYLRLFTVASQHIYGDCVKGCLDKAIDYLLSQGEDLDHEN